ncbi:hypothetical protein W97_00800 [Coniosporium apollinis CBS 100218]|uniref:Uncharacterized protein n=1 Tax=Coniosporium apollinis (strain CBS 100218) TaxID=1168221 RepID=R7YI73_CONA1|nr:uncharacterized protein W97_00800 [Coniosporium apollinis CBS 100218]EON61585.1 hypothetical protein W97_00800 [Coniosporium apollinis CBS 100218]
MSSYIPVVINSAQATALYGRTQVLVCSEEDEANVSTFYAVIARDDTRAYECEVILQGPRGCETPAEAMNILLRVTMKKMNGHVKHAREKKQKEWLEYEEYEEEENRLISETATSMREGRGY